MGATLKLCINNVIYSFLFVTRTFPRHINPLPYSLFISLVDQICGKTIWVEKRNYLTDSFLSLLPFAWIDLMGNRDHPSAVAHQSSRCLWLGSPVLQQLSQQPHGTERQLTFMLICTLKPSVLCLWFCCFEPEVNWHKLLPEVKGLGFLQILVKQNN